MLNRVLRPAVILGALAGSVALTSAPALADRGYAAIGTLGSAGSHSVPVGVAADNSQGLSKGDVYVSNLGSSTIEKFDAVGKLLATVTVPGNPTLYELTVDDYPGLTEGNVYVVGQGSGVVYRFSPALVLEKEVVTGLHAPTGVAVDEAGDLFVSEAEDVSEFNAAGEPVDASGTPDSHNTIATGLSTPLGIAVDANGTHVYAATIGGGTIEYTLTGGKYGEGKVPLDSAVSLGVVLAPSGDVYVDQGGEVAELEPSGGPPLVTFGSGSISNGYGIGFNDETGEVYVAEVGDGTVTRFEEGPTPEAPTTGAASEIGTMTATLEGELANAGEYYFAYNSGSSCKGGSKTAVEVPASGKVFAKITELQPTTQYTFCLVATNKYGPTYGPGISFETKPLPKIESLEASALTGTAATLDARVDPEGVQVTVCQFEAGTGTSYGQVLPCEQSLAGNGTMLVTAKLAGLTGGSSYHYRLNVLSANGSVYSGDYEFVTLGPRISLESASQVGSASARLSASIDPAGIPCTYHFEYGATTAYGMSTQVDSLGPASETLAVSQQVDGLTPGVEYHFRVVAIGGNGVVSTGSDDTFKALPAGIAGLPDGRVFERVTPLANENADVYVPKVFGFLAPLSEGVFTTYPFQASPDGDAVAYAADPTAGGIGLSGPGSGNEYLATRAADGGWTQVNIQPPGYFGAKYQGFSNDLSVGFVGSASVNPAESKGLEHNPPLSPEAPGEGYEVLYARSSSDGVYQPLITETPPHRSALEFGLGSPGGYVYGHEGAPQYAGSSEDGGEILFAANDTLTPNAVDGEKSSNNLYVESGGHLSLVNVLPDGSSEANATFGSRTEASTRANESTKTVEFSHVISADGSRVFWTDLNSDSLYVRENPTEPQSPLEGGRCTVSADACTVLVSEHSRFWTATTDGSKVFFTSGDLYEYNLETGVKSDLTPGVEVAGVIGAGEDGEYVYYVTTGNQLELWHGGVSMPIATLSSEDGRDVRPFRIASGDYEPGDWQPGLGHRTAEVAPDGRSVVFMSSQSLAAVGYPDGYPNEEMEEVYLYEAEGSQLICVSCARSGEPPHADEQNGGAAAYLPVSWDPTHQPRWISDDGSRVFFDSAEPLVPQDTNGQQDVYEWERDGAGSCAEAEGCIYLLSGGTGSAASWLLDASANGDDVFIISRTELVPGDPYDSFDLYDARVDGEQPVAAPACSGTGCQGVPPAPPFFAVPTSATFTGAGNVASSVTPAGPSSSGTHKAKPKISTHARKLAKALRACRAKRARRRAACETRAKRRYRTKAGTEKSTKGGS